jgi:hypothetical protein
MSQLLDRMPDGEPSRRPGDRVLLQLLAALAAMGSAVYVVAGPPRIPSGVLSVPTDPELQLELLARSPTCEQLNAAVVLLGWVFWLGWIYVVACTLLRVAVIAAMQAADGRGLGASVPRRLGLADPAVHSARRRHDDGRRLAGSGGGCRPQRAPNPHRASVTRGRRTHTMGCLSARSGIQSLIEDGEIIGCRGLGCFFGRLSFAGGCP